MRVIRRSGFGHQHARIGTTDTHGHVAMLIHGLHQLLVHLSGEHPTDDGHSLIGGDPLSADEGDLHPFSFHGSANGLAAPVDDDRVHTDDLQQDDICHHLSPQLRIHHGCTAVFDDDGLASDMLDPRHGLSQHITGDAGYAVRACLSVELHDPPPRLGAVVSIDGDVLMGEVARPQRGAGLPSPETDNDIHFGALKAPKRFLFVKGQS